MEKNSLKLSLNSEQTLIAREVPSQRVLEIIILIIDSQNINS